MEKLQVRLGFVANALRLADCSPSKTITLRNINKITERKDQISRLISISRENLVNTLRILKANYYDGIRVYRFTSRLIPLCTHPQFRDWDYRQDLKYEFQEIGAFVKNHGMRVSLHPDHFTLLNSPKPEVHESSLLDLTYHLNVIEAMELDESAQMVIHVGGKYEDKTPSLQRFKKNFRALPPAIKSRLVLENDDRCFTAMDVLGLAREISVPMVLDIHHHRILNNGEKLPEFLPDIFLLWGDKRPKFHISSPKSEREPRSHADFIDINTATSFLDLAKDFQRDLDLMIEAKQKDLALIKLAQELRERNYNLPTDGEIIL